MLYTLLILLAFNIFYEGLIVAYMVMVADKKRLWAAILSAVIEPVKMISLVLVIESDSKWLAVLVVSLACMIGNFCTLSLMFKLDEKKKPKKIVKKKNSIDIKNIT